MPARTRLSALLSAFGWYDWGVSGYHHQSAELQFGSVRTRSQFLPIGRSALWLPRFRAVVVVSRSARTAGELDSRLAGPVSAEL